MSVDSTYTKADTGLVHESLSEPEIEPLVQTCLALAESLLSTLAALDDAGAMLKRLHANTPGISRLSNLLASSLAITRTIQNCDRPVNRLPMEILAKVFGYIPGDFSDEYLFSYPDPDWRDEKSHITLQACIAPRHVCRYWMHTLCHPVPPPDVCESYATPSPAHPTRGPLLGYLAVSLLERVDPHQNRGQQASRIQRANIRDCDVSKLASTVYSGRGALSHQGR